MPRAVGVRKNRSRSAWGGAGAFSGRGDGELAVHHRVTVVLATVEVNHAVQIPDPPKAQFHSPGTLERHGILDGQLVLEAIGADPADALRVPGLFAQLHERGGEA